METLHEKFSRMLQEATKDLGLTESEHHSIEWLAGWDCHTVNNMISIINKAKNATQP